MTSPLRALTIDLGPVDLGALEPGAADPGHGFPFGSLADALHHPDALCWVRRGEGQLGFGEVARYEVTGPDRFIEAEAWWKQFTLDAEAEDPLQHPGTGPIAFGSFAFSRTSSHASRLIVPEFVLGIRDGRAWATHLTTDGRRPSERELRAAVGRWTSPEAPAALNGSRLSVRAGRLGEQHWMSAVASGVRHIRAGELEKLVLARDVVVEDDGGIPRARVLRRLASAYRDCWVYGVDGLVGATPEMLIQVEGRAAQARVLAGTLDRREAAGEGPGYAERVLAGSAKQRHEHQIAIESLTTALEPFSEALNAHDEPFILELPNVYHLASDVKAELAEIEGHVPTPLALVNALHPTAAVCGTPTQVAGELIRELEELDRGPYAGPVGWLDGAGNGEFGIALRGAVLEGTTAARLYAGCGIVEGSVPEAELAETWAKFRPMLEALGVER